MALNVNIIGKDSEGNLRALKVNSEGNLEFGQLETEIQVIKDNQGRLYGKYGEAWIPVKVDSEGRPIIASDVTVNAEGMVVDLGQIKQGPAGTEPWPVQLSGTIVRDVLGYFSLSSAGSRRFFGATGPAGSENTLQPLDIRGFKKISIYFLNGSPTYGTRNKLRVTFHRTLDVQSPENAFEIAPRYEFDDVPANGSFRLLLTSDLSDLAGTPPDGLAIRYLPDLVGLVFSYDQASVGNDGNKIILFSGVR